MTLLLSAVLLGLLAAAWVVVPVLSRKLALLGDPAAGGVLDAEARKRVAIASLREIEYDRIAGKLDDADYADLRGRLEREALLALREEQRATGPGAPGAAAHACGFLNPAGSRFCSGCGSRLG